MLGTDMCDNIIINSIVPLLYTYGKIIPDPASLKKSIQWLQELPADHNYCLQGWKRMGITVKGAGGSQALIELKKQFCANGNVWNAISAGNFYNPFDPGQPLK
jgi:hypothetical protein